MTVLYRPTERDMQQCQLTDFANYITENTQQTFANYSALHRFSVEQKERFWQLLWDYADIEGDYQSPVISAEAMPMARWFPNSRLNFANNLLRHGKPDETAIIAISESRDEQYLTYAQLRHQAMQLAAYLSQECQVQPGDRVCSYLGNTAEAIIGMLATSWIGAVWSSASPDFGLEGVSDRFGQIEPKVLITGNGYCYGGKTFARHDVVAKLRGILPTVTHVISVNVLPDSPALPQTKLFSEIVQGDRPAPSMQVVDFNHPLYILFSSGTTGKPKCIVHGTGGTLLQHTKELRLHADVRAESVLFYFTTTGWMMWNWLASGLLTGATLVLFDGNPMHPQADSLWLMAERLGVTHFGTSAKWLSACHKKGLTPHNLDLSALKVILSTGSPLQPEDFDWVYQSVKSDVMLHSISGGTDIVSCFVGGNPWTPVKRGKISAANLGMAMEAWNSAGQPVIGERGELVCTQPAPCMPVGFWNDPENTRYRSAYFERFPGVWAQGDFCMIDEDGQIEILGRSDTVLNPGGVRIGTAEIYRQVELVEQVQDSLVVGRQIPGDVEVILFVVLSSGETLTEALMQQIRTTIRSNATPRHVPRHIVQVKEIPYTRSGKKVELAVTEILRGEQPQNLTALSNASCLQEYQALVQTF